MFRPAHAVRDCALQATKCTMYVPIRRAPPFFTSGAQVVGIVVWIHPPSQVIAIPCRCCYDSLRALLLRVGSLHMSGCEGRKRERDGGPHLPEELRAPISIW